MADRVLLIIIETQVDINVEHDLAHESDVWQLSQRTSLGDVMAPSMIVHNACI
jgi:hypothetical protein